jgi:hypothetical protein
MIRQSQRRRAWLQMCRYADIASIAAPLPARRSASMEPKVAENWRLQRSWASMGKESAGSKSSGHVAASRRSMRHRGVDGKPHTNSTRTAPGSGEEATELALEDVLDSIMQAAVGLDPAQRSKLARALQQAFDDVLGNAGTKELLQSSDSSAPSVWFRSLLLAYYVLIGARSCLLTVYSDSTQEDAR